MKTLILLNNEEVPITDAELEIVRGLSKGLTIAEMGRAGGINKRTMEGRVDRLKLRTGSKTLPELVALFYKNNILK